ncbi:MAG: phosphoenolpyruvate synthase [Proteobacteria bacterium]|jgi:pyruvate, water dikinase|nr:phosphoenolpyruvate synthase [Pseudomonadota bacterium]MBT5065511.1 phosphoenolpyruvate synthase [Pseudomonadota bacterium]MBT6191995.1 phosphoenolpyruvate synthase [Pseudomonadota bacterium]MBT6673750.1 phosphoenolpyruvate synthase [Pseudomonadota bacterium]MBT7245835.1 phosphoenolpyruvate synthase [Pseudomonadota bacterium]
MKEYILSLKDVGMNDVDKVGGKNASLGEMIKHLDEAGVLVPGGFATTAEAFRDFLECDNLGNNINNRLDSLDVSDVRELAVVGKEIRQSILDAKFSDEFLGQIKVAFALMEGSYGGNEFSVAVRSSATAEDLPTASFAGQQETYLNVRGIGDVLRRIKDVFASLFNDRAISYRVHNGFAHRDVALSAGIQRMIRSDKGASGVMFTLDTESGFREAVFITASYGLGEMVVQGAVNPDEFYVYKHAITQGRKGILRRNLGSKLIQMTYASDGLGKEEVITSDVSAAERARFCIDDTDVEKLAQLAIEIEKHYQRPMDIEWAKDGIDGKLYVVQARPETVQSRSGKIIDRYELLGEGKVLAEGRSIGQKIGAGKTRVITSADQMEFLQDGEVLVTDMTDPDWEPVMKRAAAIVTNRGGRTCHAAIIARELGVPAIVGCGDATDRLGDGESVTVSCATGDTGYVYEGLLEFSHSEIELEAMPDIPVKIMMNVANPDRAFTFAALPHSGVGLARLEFIINRMIGIHPKALLELDSLPEDLKRAISLIIAPYGSPRNFFIQRLIEGISTIGAAFSPQPVIVRLSDFKSNEYANLLGGKLYEPEEENPMIGFRGASRYIASSFRECFDMECEAIRYVRNEMGLNNIEVMVPFVRTLLEAKQVIELLAENGLERGVNGLRIIMMCELPSNAILADEFLEYFDGFSIGSNDLTQLTLGLDRDSALVADRFDERNDAVKFLMSRAIQACKNAGKYVGICGQGPSDHKDLAAWLLEEGIESMSLNPDTVVETWFNLSKGLKKIV